MTGPTLMPTDAPQRRLREIAALFLRLGCTAFGGPAAHVALMEDEVVRRRAWVTRAEFFDLVGATQLIPGPNSTELALHLGLRRGGLPGLLVAGVVFILPSSLLVSGLAWLYLRHGSLPEVSAVMRGVLPVVMAVLAQALWGFGKTTLKTPGLAGLAAVALGCRWAGIHELVVLFGAGIAAAIVRTATRPGRPPGLPGLALLSAAGPSLTGSTAPLASHAAAGATTVGLGALFGFFLKIGSILFGSGYVLFAFLHSDLVDRLHWLTERQLQDAIVAGQVTPGPLFTTATFIGYLLAGPAGAVAATVGIFVPAFVLVALSGPLVPWMRRTPAAGAFLDGINVASLALMALVSFQMGRASLNHVASLAWALVAGILLVRFRVNSTWLILAGGVLGWLGSG